MATYTAVCRNPGPATPWHLLHPRASDLTLCGVQRGSVTTELEARRVTDPAELVCRRCVRLLGVSGG